MRVVMARVGRLPAPPQTGSAAARAASHHNSVLTRSRARAEKLEPKLARLLEPILAKAGREAAEKFEAQALDYLAAALTADARWSAPVGDELIDAEALVKTLRTKTDPVRLAVVETTMKAALDGVDIHWDATNPFTAKVLSQSGSQIVNIAKSTQLNVMRIIHHSYEEGLSIPDTAKAIRKGMTAASVARSVLIARTELAGAVNWGAVAATQIVGESIDVTFEKTWITADGASFPRHEDYDGLDGQTVGLDDYFDVGGYQMAFPGDPDGPPEECCNCRCAVIFTEAGVEVGEESAE